MPEALPRIYLQLESDKMCWESVDAYTFANRAKAVDDAGNKRYTGNYVTYGEDGFTISANGLSLLNLNIMARFLKIEPDKNSQNAKGFLREPEFIKFHRGSIVEMRTKAGETFRKSAKAS